MLSDPSVHIHAPPPVNVALVFDFNYKARAGDGRQCGSRLLFARFYEWYGWGATCVFCGQHYGEGGGMGRSRTPERDYAAFASLALVRRLIRYLRGNA